jgi:hypothetical protein
MDNPELFRKTECLRPLVSISEYVRMPLEELEEIEAEISAWVDETGCDCFFFGQCQSLHNIRVAIGQVKFPMVHVWLPGGTETTRNARGDIIGQVSHGVDKWIQDHGDDWRNKIT